MRAVKTAILSACVAVDWIFFLVSQHMMSYRLTGIFTKQLKSICWLLTTSCSSAHSVTSTQDKSKSTSSFDHFNFSYDLFHSHSLDRCLSGTKQSSLTVKCLDIGHCLRRRWENGKSQWPAINISVSAVFVFMSLLLPNSHLASYLSSSGSSFSCHCLVSISLLSHTTIVYDKKRLYLAG